MKYQNIIKEHFNEHILKLSPEEIFEIYEVQNNLEFEKLKRKIEDDYRLYEKRKKRSIIECDSISDISDSMDSIDNVNDIGDSMDSIDNDSMNSTDNNTNDFSSHDTTIDIDYSDIETADEDYDVSDNSVWEHGSTDDEFLTMPAADVLELLNKKI